MLPKYIVPENPMNGEWSDWPIESFDDACCICDGTDNHHLCSIHGLGRTSEDYYRKHPKYYIDLTDIPEIKDFSKAEVGKFYRPKKAKQMKPIKYFYLRDKNKFPVACVATRLTGTHGFHDKENPIAEFGVSTYNPHDKFDKKIARLTALERLASGQFSHVEAGKGVKYRILAFIAQDTFLPHRARQAASRMLVTKLIRKR